VVARSTTERMYEAAFANTGFSKHCKHQKSGINLRTELRMSKPIAKSIILSVFMARKI
jgi:hypothetical protein